MTLTIEKTKKIDIRPLFRGIFRQTGSVALAWGNGEKKQLLVHLKASGESRLLLHRMDPSGRTRDFRQVIQLDFTPCHYGGKGRAWFLCPREGCGRRVAVLHSVEGGGFFCRHCQQLTYPSLAENRFLRLTRKRRKILKRLGERGARPRGMHRSTYGRLAERLENVSVEIEQELESSLRAAVERSHRAAAWSDW